MRLGFFRKPPDLRLPVQKDTCIVFDAKGSMVSRYYNPKRGDLIANPFDKRSFSWNPRDELDLSNEQKALAKAKAMGVSGWPGHANQSESDFFFDTESQDLWTHLTVYSGDLTSAKVLAEWMNHARPEIDRRVAGSKLEQDLDPGATPQRNAIISVFTRIMYALAMVPDASEAPSWTSREWVQHRKGWIFISQNAVTKPILTPLYRMFIDMLIRDLLEMGKRPDLPTVWFILDELPDLDRLTMLSTLINQGREYGLRYVLGFQAHSQLKTIYGDDTAAAIRSAAKLHGYLRTSESETAKWESDQIGEQEVEEIQEIYNRSFFSSSDSETVKTEIKKKHVYLPSHFTDLVDLQAVIRYEGSVVPITIPIVPARAVAPDFIPRQGTPVIPREPLPIEVVEEKWAKLENSKPKADQAPDVKANVTEPPVDSGDHQEPLVALFSMSSKETTPPDPKTTSPRIPRKRF